MSTEPASQERTILVVDDDPEIRKLTSLRLEHAGYKVRSAPDGEHALEEIAEGGIDLILLDIMMPGLGGYAILERVRQIHPFSELPIIMFSARDEAEDVIRALRLGANDYAVKPIEFSTLLQRMQRHLALASPKEQVIGDYRIVRRIGEGGMGVVYEARHIETNDRVALKVLPRAYTVDDRFLARFRREAELAARIDHQNVVRFFNAGNDGETHFIVMEMVEGKDLADLRQERVLRLDECLSIAEQVASGLEALAEEKLIHRDVKPENVIVTAEGVAKLADFGIAHEISGTRLTETGIGVGSVGYASPEQLRGKTESQADVYSLGCTLFYALTGEDPFDQDKGIVEIFEAKLKGPPRVDTLDPGLPKGVADLVMWMMDPKPDQRPRGPKKIRELIERARAGQTLTALRVGSPGRSRQKILALMGAVVLLATVGWFFWFR